MDKAKSVFRDYYYVLGLKPGASQSQIQAAYNELYEKFGPHVSAEELEPDAMMKAYRDISEAYEVLMDPARRAEYDKKAQQSRQDSSDLRDLWLKKAGMPLVDPAAEEEEAAHTSPSSWVKSRGTGSHAITASGSHPSLPPEPAHEPQTDYAYGTASAAADWQGTAEENQDPVAEPPPMPAIALEVEVLVTLKEAFKGCKKEVLITDPVTCSECAGLNNPVARMHCAQCRGVGTYNIDRKEELELPAGMYEGMEISKPGQGRYNVRAGHNGDLIVKVKLSEHPLLDTHGKDITCTIPVTIYEAMLGAEIEAPCATGKVTMKIQPLTQPGRVYRLKGLGLGGADQLVTIEVILPARLSAEEVSIYKKLRDMFHEPNPREKYFQQK